MARGWSRDRWTEYIRKKVAKGAYSAIVMKQETDVWAEDCYGKTIAEGKAGVDDAEVIQKAIDYVHSKGGGEVKIREGEYSLNSTIQIGQKVHLHGCGQNTKITSFADPVFEVRTVAGQTTKYASISDLWIEGDGTNTGIKIIDSYGTILERLVIYNFKYNIFITDESYWSEATQIRDCDISGIKDTGIRFEKGGGTGGYQGTTFQNVRFHLNNENTKGIAVMNGAKLRNAAFLTPQMWISADKCTGIYVDGAFTSAWGFVRIESSVDSPTAVYGLHLDINASAAFARLFVHTTGSGKFTERVKVDATASEFYNIISNENILHGAAWGLKLKHPVHKKSMQLGWYQDRSAFEISTYDEATGTWQPEDYPLTIKCPSKFEKEPIIPVYRADYGGNFANFTPPSPVKGKFFFAEDTNASNPSKRMYVCLDGSSWSYVDLT